MENTLYIKKETSDLPKDSGLYETNMGVLFFEYGNWYKKASDAYPIDMAPFEYWFDTVSPKGMTLDEAKDKAAQERGSKTFMLALGTNNTPLLPLINRSAELFLQSNMAKVMEENEVLKKSNPLENYIEKTKRFYSINNGINIEQNQMLEVVISNKLSQLESEVLILKQAVEDMIIENNMSFVRTIGIGALQSITK